jgi:hypothetical protein
MSGKGPHIKKGKGKGTRRRNQTRRSCMRPSGPPGVAKLQNDQAPSIKWMERDHELL